MIRNLIIFLSLICLPLAAISCSIVGLEHEIEFESQSTALGTKNARALVDWFITKRDGMGIMDVSIYVTSIENNPRSLAISRERMHNIARIIKLLNKNNVPMELGDHDRVSAHNPRAAIVSNLAVVIVQPICLKTNSCCFIKQQ